MGVDPVTRELQVGSADGEGKTPQADAAKSDKKDDVKKADDKKSQTEKK